MTIRGSIKPLVIAVAFAILGCSSGPEPKSRKVVQGNFFKFALEPKPNVYDFTEYDYTYARAYATHLTNLEPAPTSYVLFQPEPLDDDVPRRATRGSQQAIEEKRAKHDARVRAYCLEHEAQFKTLVGIYQSDPFANVVTFFWPLKADGTEGDEMRRILLEEDDVETRCDLLTENYDDDRAHALLDSLHGGKYKDNLGPVMVLDLGFDALVVPFDGIKTENMDRAPDIWKQAIDDTLRNIKLSRDEALKRLQALEREIQEHDTAATNPDLKKKAQKKARENSKKKRQQKRGLLRRWFGKGSWGRAILCGFSKNIITRASSFIPDPEPIKAKMAAGGWCEQPEAGTTGD